MINIHMEELPILRLPAKEIRAKAIKKYIAEAGIKRAVCFSCGNASRELKIAGVDTIDISPTGDLVANKWWTPAEIKNVFSDAFDATSGHLPLHLMINIAEEFYNWLGDLTLDTYGVPTGSGETILCLKMAYPDIKFVGLINMDEATEWNDNAPLASVVEDFFDIADAGLVEE